MRDDTIGTWLDQLGSAAPAPGGGAAAAMNTATGAALVSMVANLTIGKRAYADHEDYVTGVRDEADLLRRRALDLASSDADAFTALMATFRLPKETDAEKASRTSAIQAATEAAARVPLDIATAAAAVIRLAASLPGRSNPSVLSDVAVAAASAAAGLESAAVNVEINLRTLWDPDVKARLTSQLSDQLGMVGVARTLVDDVRREISA